MEPGCLVQALYDFNSDVDEELNFVAKDIVQITDVIDRYWLCGVKGNESGNFPQSFVQSIDKQTIPKIQPNQALFVASETFDGGQEGDLFFEKGDFIIGLSPIDDNWWHGQDIYKNKGIFPVTHAWKVQSSWLSKDEGKKIENLFAVVKLNMKAQLDEEIDLQEGDIVKITEVIDKDWYRGECNGRSGIFPSGFVEIKEDLSSSEVQQQLRKGSISSYNPKLLPDEAPEIPKVYIEDSLSRVEPLQNIQSNDSHNNFGYDEQNSGITPYGQAVFTFYAQHPDELSFTKGEIVHLHRYVDSQWMEGEVEGRIGLVPCAYIDVIVDCPGYLECQDESGTDSSSGEGYSELTENTKAYVLYDFIAQEDEDLTLTKGQSIHLLRQIDDDWYQAKNNLGRIGLCPKNYVQIITHSNTEEERRKSVPATSNFLYSNNQSNVCNTPEAVDLNLDESIALYLAKAKRDVSKPSHHYKKSVSLDAKPASLNSMEMSQSAQQSKYMGNDSNTLANKQSTKEDGRSQFGNDLYSTINKNRNTSNIKPLQTSSIFYDRSLSESENSKSDITPIRPAPPVPLTDRNTKMPSNSGQETSSLQTLTDEINVLSQDMKLIEIEKLEYETQLAVKESSVGSDETDNANELINLIAGCKNKLESLMKTYKKKKSQLKSSIRRGKSVAVDPQDSVAMHEDVKERVNFREENIIQRRKVIVEIFATEQNYLEKLKICYDTFLKNRQHTQKVGIDTETLFGNLDEVIEVAEKLFEQLKTAVDGRAEEKQVLGECFHAVAEDMKQAYGHYCRNHDDVTALLEKYQENPAIQAYIDEGVAKIRQKQNCFNLGSILIMPVQRILKYPLLLNELHKCTEDDHPDKIELLNAINLMTDVAAAINEFKRRRDLVFKYKKDSNSSFSARLSKLNLHSVKKKSARISMRFSSTIGISSTTKDELFDNHEQKFRNIEKSAKIFLKDVHLLCEHLQENLLNQLSLVESIADYYADKASMKEVQEFRTVQRNIVNRYWEDFKTYVDKNVCVPLNRLVRMFSGPNHLIQKRSDKLLDYDNCTSKYEKCKDSNKQKALKEEQMLARNNYEALNIQLLDELPTMIELATDLIKCCLTAFINARKHLIGRIARRMFPLMDLPLLISSHGDILQNFTIKHNVVIAKVNDFELSNKFIPSASTSTLPHASKEKSSAKADGRQKWSSLPGATPQVIQSQTQNQKTYITSKYPTEALFCLESQYVASNVFDLSLDAGSIVGVIVRKDPTGSERRWFVDSGTTKGFIPANVLRPYARPETDLPPSYNQVISNSSHVPSSSEVTSLMSLSPPGTSGEPTRPRSANSFLFSNFDPLATEQETANCSNTSSNDDPFSPSGIRPSSFPMSSAASNTLPPRNTEPPSNQPISNSRYANLSKKDICQMAANKRSPSQEINIQNVLREEAKNAIEAPNVQTYDVVAEENGAENRYEEISDCNRYEEIQDDGRYEFIPDDDPSDEPQYYFAQYPYSSGGENVISLAQGQVVLVHMKEDTDGNTDWWFVEDRYGNQGYAPSVYLTPYDER